MRTPLLVGKRTLIRSSLPFAILALLASPVSFGETAPQPKPEPDAKSNATFGAASNDLPLALYKTLKRNSDALAGIQASEKGIAKLTKGDAQKALVKEVKEHGAKLIKALQASQVIHRQLSAMVLRFSEAEAGSKEAAIEALGKTLKSDPDDQVRQAAVYSLGHFKDAATVGALVGALKDKDDTVRSSAVASLGTLQDNRAAVPLLEVLKKDEKALIRMRAASALAKIKEPETLEEIVAALEGEKDLRVRMAIASAVRKIRGKDTPATKGVPTTRQQKNAFTDLSKDMKSVEEKLRNDRHDQAVQVDQKGIEDRLTKIIMQLEKMQSQSQSQSQSKQKKKSQGSKQQRQKGQGKKSGQPSSPLSNPQDGSAARGALRAAEVSGVQDQWAKLPPQLRDEMLQVYREGMPERWRKRLEAYYLSVASEEGKN